MTPYWTCIFQPDEALNIGLGAEGPEDCRKILVALSCSVEHRMPEMAPSNPLYDEPSPADYKDNHANDKKRKNAYSVTEVLL